MEGVGGSESTAAGAEASFGPSTSGVGEERGRPAERRGGESSSGGGSLFHVDTSLIPKSDLGDQTFELRDLGLDVFDQDDLEAGIMAQVDQRLAEEEERRLHNIFQKEMTGIEDDIKLAEKELAHVTEVEAGLSPHTLSASRDALRTLRSIRLQKENKHKHLKRLQARKKALLAKRVGAECDGGEGAFSLGRAKETERERMIRLGEMTPFGTRLSLPRPSPSGELQPESSAMSEFGQFLTSKDSVAPRRPRSRRGAKSARGAGGSRGEREGDALAAQVAAAKHRMQNRFDARDGKLYDPEPDFTEASFQRPAKQPRLEHNFSEDVELSGAEDSSAGEGDRASDEEYRPSQEELLLHLDDLDHSQEALPRKRRRGSAGAAQPSVDRLGGESQPPPDCHIKRDRSVRKEKDDADDCNYNKRLRALQKAEALQSQAVALVEDQEFEGGLRVPGSVWKKLFGYQQTGVRWLWELHQQQVGGIVGDEMGLGKTIQIIAFLAALRHSRLRDRHFSKYLGLGPVIVVCPTTVMHQWVKEFHAWYPEFRVAILHSSGSFTTSEAELVRSIVRSRGVLVTSYNTLVLRQDLIIPFDWHYIVLDEGHKIRNPNAQITLACKQIRTPHRLILSGSPIQNNLKELWSLFDFIFPGKLGTLPDFLQHFSVPIVQGGYTNATQVQVETAYKCATILRDTINPYLLRRMKADVRQVIKLPQKNEQVLFCRLTEEQQEVYEEYLQSRECQAILAGKYQVFAGLIMLRKIANHPDLATGGPRVFGGEDLSADQSLEYGFWRRSGKMIVVDALLRLWSAQGHRVLLFSQSCAMLNLLEGFVHCRGYTYLRMDGSTAIAGRQPLIAQYNTDPSIFLFLLTTRVGGLGVNLTGANRIIIYDPDWNPSTDTQARERAWRIGQLRQVTIYRLLTTGTIEEKIYHRQIFKQFLTNRVLKDPRQRRLFKSNDLFELFTFVPMDKEQGTETSAIFAGTGSEVVPKRRKSRANRFDARKKASPAVDSVEAEMPASEVNHMREMARKLSHMMEEKKRQREEGEASLSVSAQTENGDQKDGLTSEHQHRRKEEGQLSEHRHSMKKDGQPSEHQHRRKEGQPNEHEHWRKEGQPNEHEHWRKERQTSEHEHWRKERQTSEHQHRKKEEGKHKHRHRKRKDAKFEGQRIPHLVKLDTYRGPGGERDAEERKDSSDQDDYVLRKLFKKTGVESAMQHDKIMESSQADYLLVEAEAEKVAKAAVAALKRSRSQCHSALSGIPTWTGQQGGHSQPRFGKKKNSLLSPVLPKVPSETVTSGQVREGGAQQGALFDGSLAGSSSLSGGQGLMTSADLLARMFDRQRYAGTGGEGEEGEQGEAGPSSGPAAGEASPEQVELLTDIRNFVAFQSQSNGQASTQELLDYFRPRLPAGEAAKFKAMLHHICDFSKVNGAGVWRLKQDFR